MISVNGVIHKDRTDWILKQRKRYFQDLGLELPVSGISKWTAERKRNPEGPGRLNGQRMLSDQADLGCCNTFRLNVMGKPAYSARTIWSDRDKKDGINMVFF